MVAAPQQEIAAPEPRWPALVALVAVGGIYAGLPDYLTRGPRWLYLVVVLILLVPTVVSYRQGKHDLHRIFAFASIGVVTIEMILTVMLLIEALPARRESARELLISAGSLWVSNVLVFALWYWKLDAGGPYFRERNPGHTEGAFLFPQMALNNKTWSPNFFDYLFLSFNTSTAFSPTDTPVLARWGKLLMMLQSSISLTVIAILAGRAVNVL